MLLPVFALKARHSKSACCKFELTLAFLNDVEKILFKFFLLIVKLQEQMVPNEWQKLSFEWC